MLYLLARGVDSRVSVWKRCAVLNVRTPLPTGEQHKAVMLFLLACGFHSRVSVWKRCADLNVRTPLSTGEQHKAVMLFLLACGFHSRSLCERGVRIWMSEHLCLPENNTKQATTTVTYLRLLLGQLHNMNWTVSNNMTKHYTNSLHQGATSFSTLIFHDFSTTKKWKSMTYRHNIYISK